MNFEPLCFKLNIEVSAERISETSSVDDKATKVRLSAANTNLWVDEKIAWAHTSSKVQISTGYQGKVAVRDP